MIAQLIKELGLDLSALLRPSPDVVRELAGKRHGVFHVENAAGSPYIPAQEDFVQRYGIKSVLGFGGMLPNGELFAVILFATVPVSAASADRFRSLAAGCEERVLALHGQEHLQPDTPYAAGSPSRVVGQSR